MPHLKDRLESIHYKVMFISKQPELAAVRIRCGVHVSSSNFSHHRHWLIYLFTCDIPDAGYFMRAKGRQ